MPNHGHEVAWTDPHGAPDNAFCRRCGKVDHEADWNEPCRAGKPLTRAERRSTVSTIRMYRGAAKRCGLKLYDIREVNGDGVKYHGFGCRGFTIEFEDWKIVPGRIRHYSGSRHEPPSDEWEPINDAGPFERPADALRWLLETAHMDALHCALDDAAQWSYWRAEHRDEQIARHNKELAELESKHGK